MPRLDTRLHLNMLKNFKRRNLSLSRFFRILRRQLMTGGIYGMEWGDPETVEPLRFIQDRYVLPYVHRDHTAVELGPGGGRWTQYLLGFRTLYAIDYHDELLDQLRRNFNTPNMIFIKNNGSNFPGITTNSIDYLFSFGLFVHLELDIIDSYLINMHTILKT